MQKIKESAQRITSLAGAIALMLGIGASVMPAMASADALNPLTERSLTLSSSSPGYHYLDGSGNTTYAPEGSGNNGKFTGETFSFKVSTDSTGSGPAIKAFTFQYCTTPAGSCTPPGNGTGANQSNLNVVYPSMSYGTDFTMTVAGSPSAATDWTATASRLVDSAGATTTEKNLITLKSATGITPASLDQIVIKFNASATNYITNPGAGAFFVKINDYDTNDGTQQSGNALNPVLSTHIVDGGVTVANVMNDSIEIQTKVLETMSFSVGTVNPDDSVTTPTDHEHGTCDSIAENNALDMGNTSAENSLEVAKAYDTFSYWRLSSNSSGGATVYYSGTTLKNTVGDQITPIGTTAKVSHPGTEQFGLALDQRSEVIASDMQDQIDDDAAAIPALQYPHLPPSLAELNPASTYAGGGHGTTDTDGGTLHEGINATTDTQPNSASLDSIGKTALFAFDPGSNASPVPLASENTVVVSCATGHMRYLANIAATTPAGIYTSRINYIASPQY